MESNALAPIFSNPLVCFSDVLCFVLVLLSLPRGFLVYHTPTGSSGAVAFVKFLCVMQCSSFDSEKHQPFRLNT